LRHKWKIVFENLDFLQRKTWDSFGKSRKIASQNMKQSFSKLNYFAKSIATNRCFGKHGLVSTAMDNSQKNPFLKNIKNNTSK